MLALSSVLDHRATIRDRRTNLQLSLPSPSSLSSISDHPSTHLAKPHPALTLRPFGLDHQPEIRPAQSSEQHPIVAHAQAPVEVDPPRPKDPVLSDQELKDDVDQLIAHVDEETAAENVTSHTSTAPLTTNIPLHSSHANALGQVTNAPSENSTAETDVRLNSEEHFDGAQKRLDALLADDNVKAAIDQNDLRTLQALALQATRGDCEQKSGAKGSSLFKTDAEAASNVDIEKTDPLWGAWCIFMGSYKTDAMRDYVTKQQVIQEKLDMSPRPNVSNVASFDPDAASLDDVMTPEQQSALRLQTDRIMSHLREHDVRYLAALSLQATFGDCGPYGEQVVPEAKDGETPSELRKLREPLLEQTVVRKEGALWGAWCVMQGKKRSSAATDLSHRVDLLVDQLSKSQAATEADAVDLPDDKGELVTEGGSETSGVAKEE